MDDALVLKNHLKEVRAEKNSPRLSSPSWSGCRAIRSAPLKPDSLILLQSWRSFYVLLWIKNLKSYSTFKKYHPLIDFSSPFCYPFRRIRERRTPPARLELKR